MSIISMMERQCPLRGAANSVKRFAKVVKKNKKLEFLAKKCEILEKCFFVRDFGRQGIHELKTIPRTAIIAKKAGHVFMGE